MAAEGRRVMINGGKYSRRNSSSPARYGRQIPRRGQVKAAIVVNLAQSLSSIFSFGARTQPCKFS